MVRKLASIGFCLACWAGVAAGQTPGTGQLTPQPVAGAGTRIAVLDVRRVFQEHEGFKARMQSIETDVKTLEQQMSQMQQTVVAEQKALRQLQIGSPQHDQGTASLAKRVSDFRVNERLQRKDILEKESQIYYGTFQEIERAVAQVCQRYQIQLVVRYDSRKLNPVDRSSVLAGVNRSVVWQSPQLDITNHVLQLLNGPSAPAAVSQRPAGPQVPRVPR